MAIKALSMIGVIFATLCLASGADAYDPTGWHLPGYVAGSEGAHTAAYDANGHPHRVTPAPAPHVLTARDNAYILCVTGREPADFDFDGTCHQITKNNQNGDGVAATGGKVFDYVNAQGYHVHVVAGSGEFTMDKGGTTWTYSTQGGVHLTNTCSGFLC